ncbi:hypothetical protein CPC08DRAFT_762947 [Agrocybe pediades]|nr:hypothetical protein CPC08DRAFT_762947 [Agrocybe pediades]
MSTNNDFPFSVNQQKAYIGGTLQSTFLYHYMFGIYTGVFAASLYIYSHKQNRTKYHDVIIFGSMTTLYVVIAIQVLLNWVSINTFIRTQDGNRMGLFLQMAEGFDPVIFDVLNGISQSVQFSLADGLLVWRAFQACGRQRASFKIQAH